MKHKFRWAVGTVICSRCNKKWVAVRPTKTKDRKLQCPNCGMQAKKLYTDYKNDKGGEGK